MPRPNSSDALILGGGIIGLSIADRLAQDGLSVTLIDRGEPGREASWAGAGVLPPGSWYVDHPAIDTLALAAAPQHASLSKRLLDQTGIDDEYSACGAEYHRTPDNAAYLDTTFNRWRSLGIELIEQGDSVLAPAEAQVRNPRRLKALLAACRHLGVRIVAGAEVTGITRQGDRLARVSTTQEDFAAGAYCFAAGCWTPSLAELVGSAASGRPVRGQIILMAPSERLPRIIHRYPYYAVPRRDGRVLIGATLEDAGFNKQTTGEAFAELRAAAALLHPSLANAPVETHWAGLRPASADNLPLIGNAPGLTDTWLATGHHRSGLQLAPPTAQIVAAMIRGIPCDLPVTPFDPARFLPGLAAGVRKNVATAV